MVADDSMSITFVGLPPVSSGLLGRGKMMISWTAVGPEDLMLGMTKSGD